MHVCQWAGNTWRVKVALKHVEELGHKELHLKLLDELTHNVGRQVEALASGGWTHTHRVLNAK